MKSNNRHPCHNLTKSRGGRNTYGGFVYGPQKVSHTLEEKFNDQRTLILSIQKHKSEINKVSIGRKT